jgi:hypothetical protein
MTALAITVPTTVTMMPITICEVQYRMASGAGVAGALVGGAEGKIAVAISGSGSGAAGGAVPTEGPGHGWPKAVLRCAGSTPRNCLSFRPSGCLRVRPSTPKHQEWGRRERSNALTRGTG